MQVMLNQVQADLSQSQKENQLQNVLNKKLEEHLAELKKQDTEQLETLKSKWENTIDDLKDELANAKGQVLERDQMFQKIEHQFKDKLKKADDREGGV